MTRRVAVTGGFDDLRSSHLRFLQEAARAGAVTVLLWSDAALQALTGRPPKFPVAERRYFLSAVRYVERVVEVEGPVDPDALPALAGGQPEVWLDGPCRANAARAAHARKRGLEYQVIPAEAMQGLPDPTRNVPANGDRPRVVVTGCYDWFHSGHVRFFEEVSALGDLYVVVGHDANIRMLKGEGHPLLPAEERRYLVGSIRFVTQALISSGEGWLDADPEIQRLRPQIYAVNEDGDKGGKREYCARLGIEYRVLRRAPAPGLPRRSSTDLRGF